MRLELHLSNRSLLKLERRFICFSVYSVSRWHKRP